MNKKDHYFPIYQFYENTKQYFFETHDNWLREFTIERAFVFDHDKLNHHKKIIGHYISNSEQNINVFIVGEGNYGKSTLINAIVRGNVAKVNFLPTTWCVHRYIYGNDGALIYLATGEKLSKSIDEAKEFLELEERKSKENKAYNSPLLQIDWSFVEYEVLKYFTIVDTPGLAQIRAILSERSIEEYYYQADCVLWLIDANRVNSENTDTYLKQVSRFSKKIIGVINKIDNITVEKRGDILNTAHKHFGQMLMTIIPVSAKMALSNLNNDQKYGESNVPELLKKAKEMFIKNFRKDKNIQFYHTMKLAFNESNQILNNEFDNQRTNLYLYEENLKTIGTAYESIMNKIIIEAKTKYYGFYNDIFFQIRSRLTFGNAKHLLENELLLSSRLNGNSDEIFSLVNKTRDKGYYDLLQILTSKNYIDLIYKYDGSILSRDELTNLSNIQNIRRLEQIKIFISINITNWSKFWEGVGDTLSGLPFIGEFFKEVTEAKRNEKRDKIIREIKPQVDNNWNNTERYIRCNISSVIGNLSESYKNQFNAHFISIDNYKKKNQETDYKREKSSIDNYIIGWSLLNILKTGLKYPRA